MVRFAQILHSLLFHASYACCRIPICHMLRAAARWFDLWAPRTCCLIHIQCSLSPHNNPMSDNCHFERAKKRLSKEIIMAVFLRCSVATQANFCSTAMIAYCTCGTRLLLTLWVAFSTFISLSNTQILVPSFPPLFLFPHFFFVPFPLFTNPPFTAMLSTHSVPFFLFLQLLDLCASVNH